MPCTPTIPTGPGLNGFGFSADGGQSWTDGGAPFAVVTPGGTKVTRADPWMDTGGPGMATYYYATLGTDTTTTNPGLGGILVHTGGFKQKNFSFSNGVFIPQPNLLPNDFLDKEALCAGKSGFNKDAVAVTVTNFAEIGGVPVRLGRYMIRCPIVLKRLSWEAETAEVVYRGRPSRRAGPDGGKARLIATPR